MCEIQRGCCKLSLVPRDGLSRQSRIKKLGSIGENAANDGYLVLKISLAHGLLSRQLFADTKASTGSVFRLYSATST